jgi:hypothetical protein
LIILEISAIDRLKCAMTGVDRERDSNELMLKRRWWSGWANIRFRFADAILALPDEEAVAEQLRGFGGGSTVSSLHILHEAAEVSQC